MDESDQEDEIADDHCQDFGAGEGQNNPFLTLVAHFEVWNAQEQGVEAFFPCLVDSQVHLEVC